MKSHSHLLQRSNYISQSVEPGDIILFHQGVPHYGIENHKPNTTRVVLFSIASPSEADAQEDEQVYRFGYIGYAYGDNSIEYAKSLVESQKYMDVLNHMHTEAERQHALQLLEQKKLQLGAACNYLTAYPRRNE
jgi:hypothetical protein